MQSINMKILNNVVKFLGITLIGRSHYCKEYILGRPTNQPLEIFMRLKIEVMRNVPKSADCRYTCVTTARDKLFFPCKTSFISNSRPCGTILLNTLLFPKFLQPTLISSTEKKQYCPRQNFQTYHCPDYLRRSVLHSETEPADVTQ